MLRSRLFQAARRALCARPPFADPNPHAARAEALLTGKTPDALDETLLAEAVPLARQAVAAGSPRGQTVLGSLHLAGAGVSHDRAEAQRLFEHAAAAGDPVAMCSLGSLLLDNADPGATSGRSQSDTDVTDASTHGLTADPAVAVNRETGERRGILSLRREDGSALPDTDSATPAQLVRKVRKARRKAGFTDAQAMEFELAKRSKELVETEGKRGRALHWLERAADEGNDTAMLLLGNAMLAGGDGPRALTQWERAIAATRNISAYYNAGMLCLVGSDGVDKDEKQALKYLSMAAQLGDADAQAQLVHFYLAGSETVKPDPASARQFAELAEAQGHAAATFRLALMHRDGDAGLEKSNGPFLRKLRVAADGGDPDALALWADMYYKGADGVETDYVKALQHFLAAGRAGNSDALVSAAAMTFRGLGTDADKVHALQLYQDAAVMGNVTAYRNIATMYYHGQGVSKNQKLAEHFFRTADDIEQAEREELDRNFDPTIRTIEAPAHPMQGVPPPEAMGDDDDEEDDGDVDTRDWNMEELKKMKRRGI